MRIAIDGRSIISKTTGIGQYTEHLVRSLLKIDTQNQYILFFTEKNETITAPNLTKVNIEGFDRMVLNRWWENFLLQDALAEHRADLYFAPAYALPFLPQMREAAANFPMPDKLKRLFDCERKYRYVVTIHDLISYIHPEYFTPKMRMWQHFFVPNATKVSDMIISVSETTKQDLLRLFKIKSEKIRVIAPWFDEKYQPVTNEDELKEVRQIHSLPEKFILYLGTIEPRKNILGLVNAYALLPESYQKEYTLVLGGGLGWYADEIIKSVKELHTIGNVKMLDYVEHRHLPALYSLASVFVFPSFYEGFGSPPVEAMACGTPVITSNNSAIPGVVGDAAVLVNAYSTPEISEAMVRVLSSPQLRSELTEKGLARVQTFDWKINAKQTLQLFEETVAL